MIDIRNLEAGYGKLVVLHDLALTFPTGQFTAVLGPNGSGKSTLLKSIFGLCTVFKGEILLGGENVVGLPPEKVHTHGAAYVPQRQNVFDQLSVRENLLLAVRKLDKTQAARLTDEVQTMFPVLSKRLHQRAGAMSGGERQMLAIAMGWMLQPRVMLLDEPSAGLSPLFADAVFQALKALSEQGITLIVVEQNARRVLKWCDYAFVLREGRFAFAGTAEECRTHEETIKSYLGV